MFHCMQRGLARAPAREFPEAESLLLIAEHLVSKHTEAAEAGWPPEECCVCLESMTSDTAVQMRVCRHALHKRCLTRWLTGKMECACPVCRTVSL